MGCNDSYSDQGIKDWRDAHGMNSTRQDVDVRDQRQRADAVRERIELPLQVIEHEGWTEVWHCEQPETYVVTRQEWKNNWTERHIYAVEERST